MKEIFKFIDWVVDLIVSGSSAPVSTPSNKTAYIPSNYVEVSIETIANAGVKSTNTFTKSDSADKILVILKNNWDRIPDSTKSYAIKQLGRIQNSSSNVFTKDHITEIITKIAGGNIK